MVFKHFFNKNTNNAINEVIYQDIPTSEDMDLNIDNLRSVLGNNIDIVFRQLMIGDNSNLKLTLVYIEGLIDNKNISDFVLKPIIQEQQFKECNSYKQIIKLIEQGSIYYSAQKKRICINDVINDLLDAHCALIIDSEKTAFTFEVKGFEKRSLDEPTGENVLKGSKDAFIEVLKVNTATCRRKIKSHNLTIEEIKVGQQTQTSIAVLYMKNIANPKLVDELRKRLNAINIDRAITSGYVEEFIIDNKYTPFPQIMYTERPDKFCTNIIDGRVGIIIDGIPVAYIIPATLLQFIQAPEDFSQNFLASSTIRLLRFICMLVTLLLPGFYASVTAFHHEMIPTKLALSIATSKEGVPFPMFVEIVIMLIAFEILIEAGLRLPRTIGQSVSIVGALIVGQSAVEAKLLSPATVVIIAITAICSFTMPNQDFSNALRLWRFILVLLGSLIGLFGLSIGLLILLYHLSIIETYGIPYLDPFVSTDSKQMQDTLFRLPLRSHRTRPISLQTINKKRMG